MPLQDLAGRYDGAEASKSIWVSVDPRGRVRRRPVRRVLGRCPPWTNAWHNCLIIDPTGLSNALTFGNPIRAIVLKEA